MRNIHLEEDIQPLSEFRSKLSFYLEKIKKTKRPLIITQNGKSSAILLDVSEYQAMVDKLEVIEDIRLAESQIRNNEIISHNEVKKIFAKK